MNIDHENKAEKARVRRHNQQQQSRRDTVRHAFGCPTCKARPGEYCRGTNGFRMSHHAARYRAAAAKPITPGPPPTIAHEIKQFVADHGVTLCPAVKAKGFGGVERPATRKRAAAGAASMAQERLRGERNRN